MWGCKIERGSVSNMGVSLIAIGGSSMSNVGVSFSNIGGGGE